MGKIKVRRHDANDGRWITVEVDGLSDDVRIAAETSLPQPVAENGDVVVAGRVFLRGETPAMQWFAAEHVQVVERDDGAAHNFRVAVARQRKLTAFVSSNTFKCVRSIAVVSEQRIVQIQVAQAFRRRGVPEGHQPIRFLERQRAQQHCIDHAKDRRVRPNPQRERKHRNSRERRPLQQPSKCKTYVHIQKPNPSTDFTDSFLCNLWMALYSYLNATSGSTLVARRAGR